VERPLENSSATQTDDCSRAISICVSTTGMQGRSGWSARWKILLPHKLMIAAGLYLFVYPRQGCMAGVGGAPAGKFSATQTVLHKGNADTALLATLTE